MARLSGRANMLLGTGEKKKSFWGNVIMGAALGPVFSTCSPTYFIVLATVLPVSPVLGFVYILAYVFGLSISLLIVTFVGQKIMVRLNLVADPRGRVKKFFGILFILVGIALITGFDKKLQISILDSGFFDVTKVEQKLLELEGKKEAEEKTPNQGERRDANRLSPTQKALKYQKAIELSTPDGFINTDGKPITIYELVGEKVILLDIWTYSCINCQRTLPYLNAWYDKYADKGLEIIGLHTPEFAFEKLIKNVERATEKFGIKYPVVLDNDYSTWSSYGNRYWPRKYLIDIDGYIVYDHIGEGAYEETERKIMEALTERAERLAQEIELQDSVVGDISKVSVAESPEIYFGAWRNDRLANGTPGEIGEQDFVLPQTIARNLLYLEGPWQIEQEYAENRGPAKIVFKFKAKEVYMVASSEAGVEIEIYQDGVFVKKVRVQADQLYTLIENQTSLEHTLEIRIPEADLQAFTFTFG